MQTVPAKLTEKLVLEAEELIREGWYANKSELIRDAVRDLINKTKPLQETEADIFASELLIPYEQLKKYTADMSNIDKLAGTFLVSRQAITIAIMNFWKHDGKKKTKS